MSIRRITLEVDDAQLSALQDELCAGEELSGVCMLMMPKTDHWHSTEHGRDTVQRLLEQAGITLISDEVIG